MDPHTYVILLLCLLGVLKEFRPSEPFLSPFLNGPKNFTQAEINNDIYPVGTYSNMSLLIIIFFLTDWLRYKPILVVQGLSGILTWSLLLWTDTLSSMQLAEVFYGLYAACDVSYSSYLYAKVDKSKYSKATAQTRAALLIGKTGSGLLGQMLVLYHVMDYTQLNYLTLAGLVLITLLAFLLPPVPHSSYFNRPSNAMVKPASLTENVDGLREVPEERGSLLEMSEAGKPPMEHVQSGSYSLSGVFYVWLNAMRKGHTLKWSIWSVFSFCGYLQVSYYVQLLWQAMINTGKEDKIYHGFSNSFNSLAGALCTYAIGFVVLDWSKYGELTLAVTSAAQGLLCVGASYLRRGLIPHYAIYAVFKVLYHVSNCVLSAEIAKELESDSYAVVFGANQFLALFAQSLLTLLVTKAFQLDIRSQFFLYGTIFGLLGAGFSAAAIATMCHFKKKTEELNRKIII